MIKKIISNPLFYILLLSFLLRVYKLGNIPYGFHADEARVAWNAYSILKTGKDDWDHSFSLHYNTFGDFRPTGYFYLTIPSLIFFGLNEFAVRFPSAFFGSITVLPLFYLVKIILKNKLLAYLSSLVLATSLWHISLSRATSEATIAVFFTLSALLLLSKYITQKNRLFLLYSFLLFLCSYFLYHSARILNPILSSFFAFFMIISSKITKDIKKGVFILLLGLAITTILFGINKDARGRFSQVSIFNDLDVKSSLDDYPFEEGPNKILIARIFHNKIIVYTSRFIDEYGKYLSSNFLISQNTAKPYRYTTVGVGVLSYIEFLLFILGITFIIKKRALWYLPLAGLLIAPIPAALTTEDAPNMQRAIYMIPFFSIIIALGLLTILSIKKNLMIKFFVFSLLFLNFIYFIHMYLVHNKVHEPIPLSRNVGVKQTVEILSSLEKNYSQIFITNTPDDIYPWYAFYTKKDPNIFNEYAINRDQGRWSYQNIFFDTLRCPSQNQFQKNTNKKILVIDAEGCQSMATPNKWKVISEVKRPEGGIPYTFKELIF